MWCIQELEAQQWDYPHGMHGANETLASLLDSSNTLKHFNLLCTQHGRGCRSILQVNVWHAPSSAQMTRSYVHICGRSLQVIIIIIKKTASEPPCSKAKAWIYHKAELLENPNKVIFQLWKEEQTADSQVCKFCSTNYKKLKLLP